jgi:hypothetical protein
VSLNNPWASSVLFCRPSSTYRLEETKASPTLGHSCLRKASSSRLAPTRGMPCQKPSLYAFSNTRWVAYSEVLRSVKENPNA